MPTFRNRNVEGVERLKVNIPKELQETAQWILWKTEERGGKSTKVPKQLKGRKLVNARSNEPGDWGTFEAAVAAYAAGRVDGIGFVFSDDDPFIGIDMDNKQGDPALDAIHRDWIKQIGSYAERSPSGTGYHVIVRGDPIKGFNRSPYEAYSSGRYFTFTGDLVGDVVEVTSGGRGLKRFWTETKSDKGDSWERPNVSDFKDGSGRNDTIFREVCSQLARGVDPDTAAMIARGMNSTMAEPLSSKELEATIRNATKKHEEGEGVEFTAWLLENLIWVEAQNKYWDVSRDCLLSSKESMEKLYTASMPTNDKGTPFSPWHWLKKRGPRVVHNIGWRPIDDPFFVDEYGREHVNTYRRSMLVPRHGDPKLWLDHVAWLVPDKAIREHLLDWMAFAVQYPNRKINHALFIAGPERIGKDMMLTPLIEAIGKSNFQGINAASLEGDFNSYLDRTKLLVVNEMHTDTRTARKVENTLKQMLTAPPSTIQINAKYLAPYSIDNVVSVVFMSNHRDALTITGGNAARYLCWWCDVQTRPFTYYAQLGDWLEEEGSAIVYQYLLDRDVSTFQPKASAPLTKFASHILTDSKSSIELAIEDALLEERSPFHRDVFSPADVRDALDLNGYDKIISHVLLKSGYEPALAQKKVNGKNTASRVYFRPDSVVDGKRLGDMSMSELYSVYLDQRKNVKYIKGKR